MENSRFFTILQRFFFQNLHFSLEKKDTLSRCDIDLVKKEFDHKQTELKILIKVPPKQVNYLSFWFVFEFYGSRNARRVTYFATKPKPDKVLCKLNQSIKLIRIYWFFFWLGFTKPGLLKTTDFPNSFN